MTTWITDANGNRASVEYYGSEDAARAALATLHDCRDCTNCSGCSFCSGCLYCSGCSGIKQTESPRVVGPFRSDGYQFVMNKDGGIRAGCRVFANMAEARNHWAETRGGTPLGDETMAILDALETLDKIKTGEKP